MNKDKISSQEIIDSIASQLKINKRSAETFLKAMFAVIEEALLNGESVKVKNFGTFKLQWNEARESINVTTGEKILLDGYNKISFTPDAKLKEIVNEPFAFLEPIQLDDETTKIESLKSEETFDPLNILSDQASEIKELLLEINGLSKINAEVIADVPGESQEEEEVREVKEVKEVSEEIENSVGDEVIFDENESETFDNESIETVTDSEISTSDAESAEIPVTTEIPAGNQTVETEMDNQAAFTNDDVVEIALTNRLSENEKDLTEEVEEQVEAKAEAKVEAEAEVEVEVEAEAETNTTNELENQLLNLAGTSPLAGDIIEQVQQEEENTVTSLSQPGAMEKFVIPPSILSTPEAFSLPVKSTNKHRKGCLITLLVIFVLVVGFIVNYYLSSATRCWIKYTLLSEENTAKLNKFDRKVTTWMQSVEDWATGIFEQKENKSIIYLTPDSSMLQMDTMSLNSLPADTLPDTTNIVNEAENEKASVKSETDSLKILLDGPRVYPKTLAYEKMREGNRLTLIAERYYGLKDFWVYIYEANKDRISNPDNIANGTEIRIPKVDKRLINKDNPECIKKAKELHDLYVGKKN